MQDVNLWTSIGTIVLTGIVTITITRWGKNLDARGLAEAALIGIGPQIIAQQNTRIDMLSRQCDDCWKREKECREELDRQKTRMHDALKRISALEQRSDRP